ncbi:MAG TPA: FAD-linked oxidase [Alphaproteobacteria bacterium]|nr:FAD-linked oxidase [Alphaproteobacteria bacterium]
MMLSGWGRHPNIEAQFHQPRSLDQLQALLHASSDLIARGNGRAYGDSAINANSTIDMRFFNRLLNFNNDTGLLVAEPGVTFSDIISAFLPRGWFPLITPGSKFVTLGGAVAADVHGKNHHKDGSFRECVDWLEIMGSDGQLQRCSRDENCMLFDHTLGGMGLTGIIVRVAMRLRRVESGWIHQNIVPAANLEAVMAEFEKADSATYSVAWINCLSSGKNLGQSLLMLGEHAGTTELGSHHPTDIPTSKKRTIPFDFPSFTLNRFTVGLFNAAYYWAGSRKTEPHLVNWDGFFYPLDRLDGWNKIYGARGFAQFQCVLPLAHSKAGLTQLLEQTSRAGAGSFLAVLKRFGKQESAFSFPQEGYTLALDFPVNRGTLELMEKLDKIVLQHSGRFYLAKDSRMQKETFWASDQRAASFLSYRNQMGTSSAFASHQSRRLGF